jgi:hypothetical protein
MTTATSNPNAGEIRKYLADKTAKEWEVERLRQRLEIASAQVVELEQILAYLGGQCETCGEFGDISPDSQGFCHLCP